MSVTRVKTSEGWIDLNTVGPQGPPGAPGPPGEVYEQPEPPPTAKTGAIWIDTDAPPPSFVGPPLVTSLPASPADGAEVHYLADAVNGVVWHLRYRAGSTSAYKWEFVGGSSLASGPLGGGGINVANVWTDFVGGPTLTFPLAGVYRLRAGAMVQVMATAGAFNVEVHATSSAAGVFDTCRMTFVYTGQIYQGVSMFASEAAVTVTAASTLKLQISTNVAVSTNYSRGQLELTPVRVG